ncbi:LysE family translocator [Aidingimonas halophila]|uniref:Threonine/homoserine/homoserine lactone efflux protein n=1 Tax=Aidingimonas halophila TaxID=574349 RepID=A0A1H2U113_9GAMM|nr:LysE family transporter [Aidingimonas halophila]SDW49923.1 Threonine/homoserine/homoserine lactone efflux protein [Aidingimonas halophila]
MFYNGIDILLFAGMIGGLVITPGPSTLIVFTIAASSIKNQSSRIILGILIAMLALTAMASMLVYLSFMVSPSIMSVMQVISLGFMLLLGGKMLLSYRKSKKAYESESLKKFHKPFLTGFAISFFNPKPLAFYLSFLPKIARPSEGIHDYVFSTSMLIAIHIAMAFFSLLLYAWLGKKVSSVISMKSLNILGSVVGGVLIVYAINNFLYIL